MPGFNLPTRKLVSQQDSAMIQRPDVPRSRFTGSWTRKTTFDAGWLIPILVDEVLPGDHLSYDVTAYVRMATPLFPMFDSQRLDTHFFFVPNRLVWDYWEEFMGEQASPADLINVFTVPRIGSGADGFAQGGLADHFGLPIAPQSAGGAVLLANALPFRMYNLIWDKWFRDENLQNGPYLYTGSGAVFELPDYVLRPRAKSHDYFTSALPWTQKFTGPLVPLSGSFPVAGIATQAAAVAGPGAPLRETFNNSVTYGFVNADLWVEMYNPASFNSPNVRVNTAAGGGIAVNDLRQAFLVQQLLERDARGGTRYTEIVRSHFGVVSADARMQRPEYIGGGSTQLAITPIAQTAPTTGVPLGALGGAGTGVGQHRASYAASEHGYILGLISVRSELSYQHGIPRTFNRTTRYDYYWPSLAGLGEQAILKQELFAAGTSDDQNVFGYQERWQEYRTRYSEVTGKFRSLATGTIDPWHLAQRFFAVPVLGDTFIRDTPPMARVLAAGSAAAGMQYLADILFRRQAVRPIPVYGTPVKLGKF